MQGLHCLSVFELFTKLGIADVAGQKGGDGLPFLPGDRRGCLIAQLVLYFHLQSEDG